MKGLNGDSQGSVYTVKTTDVSFFKQQRLTLKLLTGHLAEHKNSRPQKNEQKLKLTFF